ncbi:hypothetical protein VTO73DRAFT_3460 [Trametes versicolor]
MPMHSESLHLHRTHIAYSSILSIVPALGSRRTHTSSLYTAARPSRKESDKKGPVRDARSEESSSRNADVMIGWDGTSIERSVDFHAADDPDGLQAQKDTRRTQQPWPRENTALDAVVAAQAIFTLWDPPCADSVDCLRYNP